MTPDSRALTAWLIALAVVAVAMWLVFPLLFWPLFALIVVIGVIARWRHSGTRAE